MDRSVCGCLLVVCLSTLTAPVSVSAADNELRIAMVLWRGETVAEQGFRAKLGELGYHARYTVFNAGQDRTELGRIVREELKPNIANFDYVYTFGTTVSRVVRSVLHDKVPQVFNIVAAPVEAGLVQSMEASGGNISGATNAIPLSLQLETASKLIHFKKLGLIFNPREKNSMIIRQALNDVSGKYDLSIEDLRCPPTKGGLERELTKLGDGSVVVDAVYLPPDSFLVSNAKLIGRELRRAKIKSIASIEKFVKNGALMGVVADYYALGGAAALIIDRNRKGEKMGDIPVHSTPEPKLMINRSTSQALDVGVPADIAGKALFVE